MPYRSNNVELDSADMADDVELLSNMRTVALRAGAVVLLSYPTRRSRPVLVDGNSGMALRCHSAPRSTTSRMAR